MSNPVTCCGMRERCINCPVPEKRALSSIEIACIAVETALSQEGTATNRSRIDRALKLLQAAHRTATADPGRSGK